MITKAFINDMVQQGRSLGYVEGLKLAIDIMRKHGIDVQHPARLEAFQELMTGRPPVSSFAIPDPA